MKKSAAVILAALTLSACGADQELIQKSMNNIKDEMLGIQSTMGDMQVKMQELDKNIRTNSENINKNSEGISQLREEMTVMNTDIIDLKDRVGAIEKGKTTPAASDMPLPAADSGAVMAAPAASGGKDNVIIIEDNMQDKLSLYTYAYELYRNGKYAESEAKFYEFLKKFPNEERSDNAIYWLGEIRYAQKDYPGAITRFKELLEKYPDGNKAPDALLKLGYSYGNIGDRENAIITLQKLTAEFSDTNAAKLGRQKLAQWN
ncbi:MAG: tol-pal system protein YbgF [Deferribacterales bacterium]